MITEDKAARIVKMIEKMSLILHPKVVDKEIKSLKKSSKYFATDTERLNWLQKQDNVVLMCCGGEWTLVTLPFNINYEITMNSMTQLIEIKTDLKTSQFDGTARQAIDREIKNRRRHG